MRSTGGDSGPAGDLGRAPASGAARACAPRPAWWSKPARRAKRITSRCWQATAPKPCIPIWRWKRWPNWRKGMAGDMSAEKAIYNFTKAIGKGLMKVMSKMGISTYMSYCGAQIFEAIGLNKSLVDKYFTRHRVQCRRHRRVRSGGRSAAPARAGLRQRSGAGECARCRRRIRVPRARRRAHVDAGRDRQAAAFDPRQQLQHLQGIRADHQRPDAAVT